MGLEGNCASLANEEHIITSAFALERCCCFLQGEKGDFWIPGCFVIVVAVVAIAILLAMKHFSHFSLHFFSRGDLG